MCSVSAIHYLRNCRISYVLLAIYTEYSTYYPPGYENAPTATVTSVLPSATEDVFGPCNPGDETAREPGVLQPTQTQVITIGVSSDLPTFNVPRE